MKRLIFLSLLIGSVNAFAQKTASEYPMPDNRQARSSFDYVELNVHPKSAAADVQKYILSLPNFQSPNAGARLQHDIFSPIERHFTFEQLYDSLPVYNSQVKLNLDKKGNITSLFDNSYSLAGWDIPQNELNTAPAVAEAFAARFSAKRRYEYRKMIYYNERQQRPQVVFEVKVESPSENAHHVFLISTSGEVLLQNDLYVYADSTVNAFVFLPDPLTTADTVYGGRYKDFSDADTPSLNNERFPVKMKVSFENDTFRLESPFVKIVDMEAPAAEPAFSTSPVFDFTRAQNEFEDVNTYYHISEMKKRLDSLGLTNLMNYQIYVDPHGTTDDNSYFSSFSSPPRLVFGDGGVDDAEDADVIIHEYAHAISHSAAPGTNSGFERQALDEGFGDYLAASYSRQIKEFGWERVFTWDGHNEFWPGRNANSDKRYPDGLSGSYHQSGEIWSSALMDIWAELGADVTDRLVMLSMFGYAANMTMEDAARLLVQADTSGKYGCIMQAHLFSRGLLSTGPFTLKAGDDTLICSGDTVQLSVSHTATGNVQYDWRLDSTLIGDSTTNPLVFPATTTTYTVRVTDENGCWLEDRVKVLTEPGAETTTPDTTICSGEEVQLSTSGGESYSWRPAQYVSDLFSAEPVAAPISTTVFYVDIINEKCTLRDSVLITVEPCFDELVIWNSEAFAKGTQPLLIGFPESVKNADIRIFNMQGREVYKATTSTGQPVEIQPLGLPHGIYIVSVKTSTQQLLKKIARF